MCWSFSRIWLSVTAWTVACQAPLSMEKVQPFTSPGIFLTQESSPGLLHSLPSEPPDKFITALQIPILLGHSDAQRCLLHPHVGSLTHLWPTPAYLLWMVTCDSMEYLWPTVSGKTDTPPTVLYSLPLSPSARFFPSRFLWHKCYMVISVPQAPEHTYQAPFSFFLSPSLSPTLTLSHKHKWIR